MTNLVRINGDILVGTPVTLADGSQFVAPVTCLVDSSGNPVAGGGGAASQNVQGAGANGAAATGNPVLVAGSDGTNARTLNANALGYLSVSVPNGVVLAASTQLIGFTKAPPLAHTASAVVAGSGTSQQLFAANATRTKLIIQNQDAAINVFVNLGAAATAGSPSLRIAPGATLELTGTNATVNLIAASGTPAIAAWQF